MTPKLKLVESRDAQLKRLFREWDEARNAKLCFEAEIQRIGRELAKERGLSFIRFESLQQEFGGR